MNQSSIAIIIYILGILFGAFFLDLWSSDTNIKKGLFALGWTEILLIALFYADRNKER